MQSQVVGARVGNSVAAFAMERLGVRVFQLPTTLLGRRPDHGPPGGGPIPAETLTSLLEGLADDGVFGEIDAVLTGYIGEADQVAGHPRCGGADQGGQCQTAVFICDPVLGDDGQKSMSTGRSWMRC